MKAGSSRALPGWVILTACTVFLAGSALSSTTTVHEISSVASAAAAEAPRYAGPSLTNLPLPPPRTEPPTTTTTTAPPRPVPRTPSCANSYDRPECGIAHWDPPVVDQPATLTVSIDPAQPKVGDLVTFTFHWSDADADVPYFDFCDGVSPCSRVSARTTGPRHPTGPWTPPQARGADGYIIRTATYTEPGAYTWYADLATASSTYDAWAGLNPDAARALADPYRSGVQIQRPIVVTEAAPTPSTSTSTSTTSTTTLPPDRDP